MKNNNIGMAILIAAGFVVAVSACSYTDEDQGVFFLSPVNGATVGRSVKVEMGVKGMKVRKAGKLIEGTGHHHLIIDGSHVPKGVTVPKNRRHLHFGKGQTEATILLSPGEHVLTLQFANGHHQSYGRAWSKTVRVTVK